MLLSFGGERRWVERRKMVYALPFKWFNAMLCLCGKNPNNDVGPEPSTGMPSSSSSYTMDQSNIPRVCFSCHLFHAPHLHLLLHLHSHGVNCSLLSPLSSTTMPLIVLTGHPCSGKSHRANQIKQYMLQRLSADGRSMRIHIVNDDSLNVSKEAYRGI